MASIAISRVRYLKERRILAPLSRGWKSRPVPLRQIGRLAIALGRTNFLVTTAAGSEDAPRLKCRVMTWEEFRSYMRLDAAEFIVDVEPIAKKDGLQSSAQR